MLGRVPLPELDPLLTGEVFVHQNLNCIVLSQQQQQQQQALEMVGSLTVTIYQLTFRIAEPKCVLTVPLASIFSVSKQLDRIGEVLELRSCDFKCLRFQLRGIEATLNLPELLKQWSTVAIDSFALKHHAALGIDVCPGWKVFDAVKEWQRQGVPNAKWRLSYANTLYKLCPTYPPILALPVYVNDKNVYDTASCRNRGRFPILVHLHSNGAAILRASQRKLAQSMEKVSYENIKVFEARMRINSQTLATAASEKDIEYLGLDNISATLYSYRKLQSVLLNSATKSNFFAALHDTEWLKQLSQLLRAADSVAATIDSGQSVLVQCLDGWDRTSQLSVLAPLLIDPFYRTMEGFAVLLERELLYNGHRFRDRMALGKPADDPERSPIFAQLIDAIWQVHRQRPECFEFGVSFLSVLLLHSTSAAHGTFLNNCEQERDEKQMRSISSSVWGILLGRDRHIYRNPYYVKPIEGVLRVECAQARLALWSAEYMRCLLRLSAQAQDNELQIAVALSVQRKAAEEAEERQRQQLAQLTSTSDENIRKRNAEMIEKLAKAEKAVPMLESTIAQLNEQRKKLIVECNTARAELSAVRKLQKGPNREQTMLLRTTKADVVLNLHSAETYANAPLVYRKFYQSLLKTVKELLKHCETLTDNATSPLPRVQRQKACSTAKSDCVSCANELIELVQISPQSTKQLLQESKAVCEAVLTLTSAVESSYECERAEADELRNNCHFVANCVRVFLDEAIAPIRGDKSDPVTEKKRHKIERMTMEFGNRKFGAAGRTEDPAAVKPLSNSSHNNSNSNRTTAASAREPTSNTAPTLSNSNSSITSEVLSSTASTDGKLPDREVRESLFSLPSPTPSKTRAPLLISTSNPMLPPRDSSVEGTQRISTSGRISPKTSGAGGNMQLPPPTGGAPPPPPPATATASPQQAAPSSPGGNSSATPTASRLMQKLRSFSNADRWKAVASSPPPPPPPPHPETAAAAAAAAAPAEGVPVNTSPRKDPDRPETVYSPMIAFAAPQAISSVVLLEGVETSPKEIDVSNVHPQEILRWGYLLKRSERSKSKWEKRWCVLRVGTLQYYKTQKDAQPRDTLRFDASTIVQVATSGRLLVLGAKDDNEANEWAQYIRACISASQRR